MEKNNNMSSFVKLAALAMVALAFFKPAAMAQSTTSVNMSNGTTTVNEGSVIHFYDNGGPGSDYSNNQNLTHTFTSATNGKVTITFTSSGGETCCDYITIYDGPNTSSSVLLQGSGGNLNSLEGLTFTSTNSSLTVYFHSDGSVVGAGWEATVYSPSIRMNNGSTMVDASGFYDFFDDGGASANYSSNQDLTHTFTSTDGSRIQIAFTSGAGDASDYIAIYDGPNASATPLFAGTAGNLNSLAGQTFTSTGTSLTVVFHSDGSGVGAGWASAVSGMSVNMSNGTTMVECGTPIQFYDNGGPDGNYLANSNTYVHTFTSEDGIIYFIGWTVGQQL